MRKLSFRKAFGRATAIAIVVVVIVIAGFAGFLTLSQSPSPSTTSKTTSLSTTAPASTSATTTQSTPTSMIKLSVATTVPTFEGFFWPMLIGTQQGIFQRHGLDVSWTPYSSGGALAQAVAAGSAPVGLWGVLNVVQSGAAGVPVKLIGVYIPNNTFEVFVSGTSEIRSIGQLNGTSVGVSGLGGLEQFYFQLIAQRNKLTFNYVATGGLTSSVALLKTSRINAFVFTKGSVLSLLDSGQIRSIYKVSDAEPNDWQDGFGVYATNQFIQQNPETTRRFVAAVLDTVAFIKNNPQVASQVYMKQTNSTQTIAQEAFSNTQWQLNGQINAAGLQSMENEMIRGGLIKGQGAPASNFYDASFLP